MEQWCQKINVHCFCLETDLFRKIFGQMCKGKIVYPPPSSGGWLREKSCMLFPGLAPPPPLRDSQLSQACVGSHDLNMMLLCQRERGLKVQKVWISENCHFLSPPFSDTTIKIGALFSHLRAVFLFAPSKR